MHVAYPVRRWPVFCCLRPHGPARKSFPAPGADPQCFKPSPSTTKYLQWDKKPGPYRIALVNGFVGNTWRIQMIKTAKAFFHQSEIKENIKEFKVVSTGTDVAAQLGAIEDFINQGYDAIVTIAVAREGFDRVIRLADKNNVVVVPFDNILDTNKVMKVNEDQQEIGRMARVPAPATGQDRRQHPRSARPARQLRRPRRIPVSAK